MAIYVPPSTRRRRLVLLVAAGLVVGLLLGFVVGRGTAEGIDDAVESVRDQAADAATALQRIPIEYEQALAGGEGESMATIAEAVDAARDQLDAAWDEATWFGPGPRQTLDRYFRELDVAVTDHVELHEFEVVVASLVELIGTTFGIDTPSSS